MIWPLALLSWLVMGLAAGLLGARLLPGVPPLGGLAAAAVGVVGAVAGGVVATFLGFGGLVSHDWRALLVATLAAILAVLLLRIVRL